MLCEIETGHSLSSIKLMLQNIGATYGFVNFGEGNPMYGKVADEYRNDNPMFASQCQKIFLYQIWYYKNLRLPYKDPNKRKELIKKHYNKNKDYYKKKANKWKAQNKDKVKESRIRYSEKKKIISELNDLQISFFKTDKSSEALRDFFINNENELKEILRKIISIQYNKIYQKEIEKSKLNDIVKSFYSSKNTRNVDYYNYIEIVVLKNISNEEIGNISGKLFNTALYSPILNLIKNEL